VGTIDPTGALALAEVVELVSIVVTEVPLLIVKEASMDGRREISTN